uniref:Uncharacterized protein n=1 Tax=Anguilla anguilla TaxID=7936 RepID=A0A0E9UK76_ANGAN
MIWEIVIIMKINVFYNGMRCHLFLPVPPNYRTQAGVETHGSKPFVLRGK